jgi:hypothetical protein
MGFVTTYAEKTFLLLLNKFKKEEINRGETSRRHNRGAETDWLSRFAISSLLKVAVTS